MIVFIVGLLFVYTNVVNLVWNSMRFIVLLGIREGSYNSVNLYICKKPIK